MKRVPVKFQNDHNETDMSTEGFKISNPSTNTIYRELLISNKSNIVPNRNDLLCTAVKEDKFDDVLRLLNDGVDPNVVSSKGDLAIMSAVFLSNINILQLLLDRGANIDAADVYGWTALHAAIVNQRVEPARLLIKKGARTDIESKTGVTALGACELLDENNEIRTFLNGAAPYAFLSDDSNNLENEENTKHVAVDSDRLNMKLS